MAFLRVMVDIHFKGNLPRYRTWINDELFVERTWYWPGAYAEEMFQVEAPPGQYQIRVENLNPGFDTVESRNLRVDFGPGRILDNNILEVYDESQ